MTTRRVRKTQAYKEGRLAALGGGEVSYPPSSLEAGYFREGYHDANAELVEDAQNERLLSGDLHALLQEAEAEADFFKLCAVVRRMLEGEHL